VKVDVAPSPASDPIHKAIMRPRPPTESDDGRVVVCMMLEAPSAVPCASSSSSDSSGSESIMALPPPVPDMLISSVLQDISEMPEVETAHPGGEPVEIGPRAKTSAGIFLYIL
jgi:hypothetical protein